MNFILILFALIAALAEGFSIFSFVESRAHSKRRMYSVLGIIGAGIIIMALILSNLPSPTRGSAQNTNQIATTSNSQQGTTATPLQATPTTTPIPTLPPTPTEVITPTATACLPTGTPGTTPTTGNVDAVVTIKGCPPEEYPVTWVFGFKGAPNDGIGETASAFIDYGNGYIGYISELGLSPIKPYSGPPLTSWLCWLNSGGFAIVVSDTPLQPTVDQLGSAALYGGYVDFGGGTYLSQTFELTSTTPQPQGVQGYQFNLVVKKS